MAAKNKQKLAAKKAFDTSVNKVLSSKEALVKAEEELTRAADALETAEQLYLKELATVHAAEAACTNPALDLGQFLAVGADPANLKKLVVSLGPTWSALKTAHPADLERLNNEVEARKLQILEGLVKVFEPLRQQWESLYASVEESAAKDKSIGLPPQLAPDAPSTQQAPPPQPPASSAAPAASDASKADEEQKAKELAAEVQRKELADKATLGAITRRKKLAEEQDKAAADAEALRQHEIDTREQLAAQARDAAAAFTSGTVAPEGVDASGGKGEGKGKPERSEPYAATS